MITPQLMGRTVGRQRASQNPAMPRTARLVTSSVLIVALTQYGCSSFRVRGPSPDATPPAENSIAISPSRPAVRVDDTAQLTLRKADGFVQLEEPIVWTSSDRKVLDVISMGERARIVGISPGNARVSVTTANGYSAWVTVRVYVNLARQGPGCRGYPLISTLKCNIEQVPDGAEHHLGETETRETEGKTKRHA